LSKEVEFDENKKNFYSIKKLKKIDLSKAAFILMRQNPPFNMDYITSTFLLEKISKGTQIVNNPFAVRNMPEKLYSTKFLKLILGNFSSHIGHMFLSHLLLVTFQHLGHFLPFAFFTKTFTLSTSSN